VDRCRVLYQKYLEFAPFDCFVWQRYAELERAVGETARARAIFEVAVQQPQLDMPEQLWKRYIDFELGLGSQKGRDNARRLYERLLERTQHVKVWLSFARFEAAEDAAAGRKVFARAYDHVKAAQQGEVDLHGKEARALVLQAWLEAELKAGADSDEARRLHALQPQKVKRRREVEGGGWQEYVDFLFPDDPKKGLKLLQIAQKWKASEEQGPHKKLKADLDAPHAPAPAPVRDTNEIDLDGV
jgi:crooked neck